MPTSLIIDCLDVLLPFISKMVNYECVINNRSFPKCMERSSCLSAVQERMRKYGIQELETYK